MKWRLDWILLAVAASCLVLVLGTQSWEESRSNAVTWFAVEGWPMLVVLILYSALIAVVVVSVRGRINGR